MVHHRLVGANGHADLVRILSAISERIGLRGPAKAV
jgi:hypothetical protein